MVSSSSSTKIAWTKRPPTTFSPNEPLILVNLPWEGTSSASDHELSFILEYAVFADVPNIPIVPAKLLNLLCKKMTARSIAEFDTSAA